VTEALHSERISAERAVAFCANGEFDRGQLEEAAKARRADLLVHLALTMFPGAPSYAHLPRSIQRDVRTFFGSHSVALEKARGLLFSVGRPENVLTAWTMP